MAEDSTTGRGGDSPAPPGSTGFAAAGSTALSEDAASPVETSAGDRRVVLAGQVGLFALAAYVVVESLRLDLWTGFGPGPGFFPVVLGTAIGALCLVWFFQTQREDAAAADPGEALPLANVGVVLLSLVVLAALMDLIGFQISVFAFLLFHLKLRAHRGWLLSVAIALAGSFGVFVGFTQGLLVELPQSSITFLSNLGL